MISAALAALKPYNDDEYQKLFDSIHLHRTSISKWAEYFYYLGIMAIHVSQVHKLNEWTKNRIFSCNHTVIYVEDQVTHQKAL